MSTDSKSTLASIVGASIAARRKQKGLTQAQFAELLDITQDSPSRMEKGVIAPKLSRLQYIATMLDCARGGFASPVGRVHCGKGRNHGRPDQYA